MNNKAFLPTSFDCFLMFILCVLPWVTIFLYLNNSPAGVVLSFLVTLGINVLYVYIFQCHRIGQIIAFIFKSLETLFSFLILMTQGPFDLFFAWRNIDATPALVFSNSIVTQILFFSFFILVCVLNYVLYQKVKVQIRREILLVLPVLLILVQKPNVNYIFLSKIVSENYVLKGDVIHFPTISKDQEIHFTDKRNVIYLHLEGLNSKVVNGDVLIKDRRYNTPAAPIFLEFSKRGIYFPEFYNNAMMTIGNQESILCGIADNLGQNHAQWKKDFPFKCLPEIFSDNGYATYFFKSDELSFSNTGDYMRKIGFNTVLQKEIMSDGDKEYAWGYSDDIFYKRVFEYLSDKKSEKKFVYIAVAALNHYPYDNLEEFKHLRVYPEPKNYYERFTNTTRQQDEMLKVFFHYFDQYANEDTHLVVFGDHSVPVGINGTVSGFTGLYDDIFLTSMFYVLPNLFTPKVVKNRYSHVSFFHTILELFSDDYTSSLSIPEITPNIQNDQTHYIRLNQSKSDNKRMAIVQYPHKWTYDFFTKEIGYFDLKGDRFEQNQLTISEQSESDQFIQFVREGKGRVLDSKFTDAIEGNISSESMSLEQKIQQYLKKGIEFGVTGDHDLAIDEFERAVTLKPNDPSLHILVGNAYMNIRAFDMAIMKFERAIAIDPGAQSATAYLNLGSIYANSKKNYLNALKYLEMFVTLTPDKVKAEEIRRNIEQIRGVFTPI